MCMHIYIYTSKCVCVVQCIHQCPCMDTISFVTCTQQCTKLPTTPMKARPCGKLGHINLNFLKMQMSHTPGMSAFRSSNAMATRPAHPT